MSSTRAYRDAIDHLNSLQSNAAVLDAVRASGGRSSEFAIPEMLEYLERIGYKPNDLNALNVIHITGTKGKGSTSAFVNSILQHTKPSWKVGLYTSPHLVAVRERIRVNGIPISEEDFTRYFYEVWDKLVENDHRRLPQTSLMPGYFRFLTLLAFHAFLKMKVDVTILEVGVGGTYDSTNIVPKPVVTGITALGIDHVSVLGKTLKEIAWQKGGIFKEGTPAISVAQPSEGMEIIEQRAKELQASSFKVVKPSDILLKVPLGLAGKHQIQNAAIAVELARTFLQGCGAFENTNTDELPQTFAEGLKATKWPGRCQVVSDPVERNLTWYLDGAHTLESLDCCMEWFLTPGVGVTSKDEVSLPTKRILVFNCTSGRSGQTFLEVINDKIATWTSQNTQSLTFFDQVIFCTNVTYADGHFKGDLTTKAISDKELVQLTTQNQLATAWSSILPDYLPSNVHVLPSIEHAINHIKRINDSSVVVKILVAGSLHLVGGVVEVAGLSKVAL
ncbi:FolC bifunctional protein [Macrolepiota fuliginosa MF-IS2]|uniref:Folylpolyglutamate synthase n=1 Tax=Macrolepiota fuliginosa MF-IS2 TaxID=1400762 RepID=A0A9P6C7V5_9AGAR|nr:FolC bifunctional protein [Macrolepiota fuliginosa MF-IS2]